MQRSKQTECRQYNDYRQGMGRYQRLQGRSARAIAIWRKPNLRSSHWKIQDQVPRQVTHFSKQWTTSASLHLTVYGKPLSQRPLSQHAQAHALEAPIWGDHGIRLATQVALYSCLLSSRPPVLDTSPAAHLDQFHLHCLRKLAPIEWHKRFSDSCSILEDWSRDPHGSRTCSGPELWLEDQPSRS